MVVVDGFIESIDTSRVPERLRPVIVARTNALIGKRHITLGEIERRLLIAGDAPGLRLRSTLARGQREGGTRLVLEGIYRQGKTYEEVADETGIPLGTMKRRLRDALMVLRQRFAHDREDG